MTSRDDPQPIDLDMSCFDDCSQGLDYELRGSVKKLVHHIIYWDEQGLYSAFVRDVLPQLKADDPEHAQYIDAGAPALFLTLIVKYQADECFTVFQDEYYATKSTCGLAKMVSNCIDKSEPEYGHLKDYAIKLYSQLDGHLYYTSGLDKLLGYPRPTVADSVASAELWWRELLREKRLKEKSV